MPREPTNGNSSMVKPIKILALARRRTREIITYRRTYVLDRGSSRSHRREAAFLLASFLAIIIFVVDTVTTVPSSPSKRPLRHYWLALVRHLGSGVFFLVLVRRYSRFSWIAIDEKHFLPSSRSTRSIFGHHHHRRHVVFVPQYHHHHQNTSIDNGKE